MVHRKMKKKDTSDRFMKNSKEGTKRILLEERKTEPETQLLEKRNNLVDFNLSTNKYSFSFNLV